MTFVHEDPEFRALLGIVAEARGIAPALVEKDYWVTHVLWSLHQTGLDIWFKGGTSLSKGFALIERFSEDLDLYIEPGTISGLPQVKNWTGDKPAQIEQRIRYFEVLASVFTVPGAPVVFAREELESKARGANYHVKYPGSLLADLAPTMRPFVLLEVGKARVKPFEQRALTSFVHDHLERAGQLGDYTDNRPGAVRCLHPLVTLLEKLDAVSKRYARGIDPASYIRHYEDAAKIIEYLPTLPPLAQTPGDLVEEMLELKQIAATPTATDPAFALEDPQRRKTLEQAHQAIAGMYWGARRSLDEACAMIRAWLGGLPATSTAASPRQ